MSPLKAPWGPEIQMIGACSYFCLCYSNVPDSVLASAVFLDLFVKHRGEGRVVVPLLKTIDTLMNRLCIDRLLSDEQFISSLIGKLRQERQGCTNIPLLSAILTVATGLISSVKNSPEAIAFVCEFLVHDFPHIRSLAAEKLYVRLQETDPDLNDNNNAINLLLYHAWETDTKGAEGCITIASQVTQELVLTSVDA